MTVASATRTQPVHIPADEERQRNRHADGERAPGAVFQRVHHREAEPRERDDDDEEDGERGGRPRDRPDFGACDVGEGGAATAGRGPQHDHVVDAAGEADAADEPDESRRVTELGREHRPDERARAGDRREMMPEQHPAGRDVVVLPVGTDVRRRGPAVVETHHTRREERAVVPVGDSEDAEDREDDVKGPHRSLGGKGGYH